MSWMRQATTSQQSAPFIATAAAASQISRPLTTTFVTLSRRKTGCPSARTAVRFALGSAPSGVMK